MDIEKLKKSLEGHGFAFRYFETGAEAADYLAEQMAGKTVGIGGSKTVEAIGLYEKLQGKAADVAWHWKTEPNEARAVRRRPRSTSPAPTASRRRAR